MANSNMRPDTKFKGGEEPARKDLPNLEMMAIGLSLLWLGVAGFFFWFFRTGSEQAVQNNLQNLMILLAVFMPVSMIWVSVMVARAARQIRRENHRLHLRVGEMQNSITTSAKSREAEIAPSVEKALNEIALTAQKTESALAVFTSTRQMARLEPAPQRENPKDGQDQPFLALGNVAEENVPQIERRDLIRALNFPDTESDEVGFAALRKALKDRNAKQLIQASQDMLTLLSQDGVYMDDLHPDRARPEIWRRFAQGERGKSVAALGGIRDRSSLALTAGRMREDTIFRDAVHHFLRRFDQMLIVFEKEASDAEIIALSDTRTARAFMLVGRVSGAFD